MLILSRRVNERIRIGEDITISVLEIGRSKVRIAITAPPEVAVMREELVAAAGGQTEGHSQGSTGCTG